MKKPTTKLYARHGDVFIFRVNKKISIKNSKKEKELVLALGEITGHSHRLRLSDGDDILVEEYGGNDSFLFELNGNGILTHEEHDSIVLTPGQYISIIQSEYSPIEHRKKVID